MNTAKQPTVWVLVADGDHARVVTPQAVEGRFATVLDFKTGDSGAAKHSPGSRLDPHAHAEQVFIADIAHQIDHHDQLRAFDQLVLVAPPHALHDLREALGKSAQAKVVGSLHKDLVKLNDHDLSPHLKEFWLAPAAATP